MIPENSLVYDIETSTNGASFQELGKHKLRFFGAYSYLDKKYYFYNHHEKNKIKALIARHKFLIGFNNKYYDNPILEHEGISTQYKIIIDLKKIMDQRQGSIMWKGVPLTYQLKDDSLDTITRTLELVDDSTAKGNIDYNILNKETFTPQELLEISQYTARDIAITKKLFDWAFNWFDSWKHHLTEEDQKRLVHITCDPSVYSYKVICKKAGMKEDYAYKKGNKTLSDGAYVAYPAIEKCEGNVYCLDFASIYPHAMIQGNMFGRNKEKDIGWNGYDNLKTLGYYDTNKMSKVSRAIWDMYKERKALKKAGDPKEYGLKIAMNIIYGILRNEAFQNTYDEIAGNDVCTISQYWIKYARDIFKENGYDVFYTDTDSLYFEDKFDDKERLLKVKDDIMDNIKKGMPFPVDTFDMDIDYDIDLIHFFKPVTPKKDEDEELDEYDIKAKPLGLLKKNYLFVYKKKDGSKELIIKNLGIVKRSNTPLSKKIVYKKMKPMIINEHKVKFSNEQIKEWVKEYLEKDPTLLAKRYTVRGLDSYKSKGCIQAQIHEYIPEGKTQKLGPGTYFLLPNKKKGAGKGHKKYCTIEEYHNNLKYEDLYLDIIMSELSYFNENYQPEKMVKKKKVNFLDKLKQEELW